MKEINYTRYSVALDHLYGNLDQLIQNGVLLHRKIYMFGSSKVAGMIISYLQEKQIPLAGIIDNNSACTGSHMLGLEISLPDILAKQEEEVFVLIASAYQDAMIQQLEQMGYQYGRHIQVVLDIHKEMDDYSYADRSGYIPLTDQEVRESQLKVLQCVKRVCEKHGLHYYLAYGTLLGAVRHQGFIPWDDDIDIYIPVSDLKCFVEVVKAEQDFDIVSTAVGDDYYEMVSKMYDCNTICDSNQFPMQTSAGVSIDVFPIFGLPDTEEQIGFYYEELKKAEAEVLNRIYDRDASLKASKEFFELMGKYDIRSAKYIGNILSTYQLKEIFPAEWFQGSRELDFEHETFSVPAGYDGYLQKVYGNYLELPPENERKEHHFFHVYHSRQERGSR